jgi:hypothetical protein
MPQAIVLTTAKVSLKRVLLLTSFLLGASTLAGAVLVMIFYH